MSLKAEQILLSNIITKPEIIKECKALRPEMFDPQYRLGSIYSSILSMVENGKDINPVSVVNNNYSKFSNKDFESIVVKCIAETNDPSYIFTPTNHLVESIMEDWKARCTAELLHKFEGKVTPKNYKDVLADFKTMTEEFEDNKTTEVVSMAELVDECMPTFFTKDKPKLLNTGFPTLDKALGGAEPGDVMCIAARPGQGKTALTMQLIDYYAKQGMKIGLYSLEMMKRQIFARYMAYFSEMKLSRIRMADEFTGNEQQMYERAAAEMRQMGLDIVFEKTQVEDIVSSAKYRNYDVIVIDYLQLLSSRKSFNQRNDEVAHISRTVKNLAKTLNIPIIVLSQLNRASASGHELAEPTLSQIRESGAIEQDVSIALMIWDDNKEGTVKNLKIFKNRQGSANGSVKLNFDGDHMRFYESDENRMRESNSGFTPVRIVKSSDQDQEYDYASDISMFFGEEDIKSPFE